MAAALVVAAAVTVADVQARRASESYAASVSAIHDAQAKVRVAQSAVAAGEAAATRVATANTQLVEAAGGLVGATAQAPVSVQSAALVKRVAGGPSVHDLGSVAPAPANGWDLGGWSAVTARNLAEARSITGQVSSLDAAAATLNTGIAGVRAAWEAYAKNAPTIDTQLTAGGAADLVAASHAAAVKLATVDPVTPAGVAAWKAWAAAVAAAKASVPPPPTAAAPTPAAPSTGTVSKSATRGAPRGSSGGTTSHGSSGGSSSSGATGGASGGGSSAPSQPSCSGNQENACVKTPPTFATNGNFVPYSQCKPFDPYTSHNVGYGGRSLSGQNFSFPWSAYVSGPTVYYGVCG